MSAIFLVVSAASRCEKENVVMVLILRKAVTRGLFMLVRLGGSSGSPLVYRWGN